MTGDTDAHGYHYAGPRSKRLTAEQFYDALASLTGVGRANPAFEVPGATERGGFVRAWRVTLWPTRPAWPDRSGGRRLPPARTHRPYDHHPIRLPARP